MSELGAYTSREVSFLPDGLLDKAAGRDTLRTDCQRRFQLPRGIRRDLELFFGQSFAKVRITIGPQATAIGASAFAHGSDLYFAPGFYELNTHRGRAMLGHEIAHIVQQRSGRVQNPHGAGIAIVNSPELELEADLLGQQFAIFSSCLSKVHVSSQAGLLQSSNLCAADTNVVQCIHFPAWWNAGTAANVEAWIAAHSGLFPNSVVLYHGTTATFHATVTGFNGNEQAWVNNFFQFNLGATTHAGPGIYGANTLLDAQQYGASIMKVIASTMSRTRYLDVRAGHRPALPANVTQQDVLRYGYRCVLRYQLNYFAVKDHRVEWEPN